jgi:hypothetical protein
MKIEEIEEYLDSLSPHLKYPHISIILHILNFIKGITILPDSYICIRIKGVGSNSY